MAHSVHGIALSTQKLHIHNQVYSYVSSMNDIHNFVQQEIRYT